MIDSKLSGEQFKIDKIEEKLKLLQYGVSAQSRISFAKKLHSDNNKIILRAASKKSDLDDVDDNNSSSQSESSSRTPEKKKKVVKIRSESKKKGKYRQIEIASSEDDSSTPVKKYHPNDRLS